LRKIGRQVRLFLIIDAFLILFCIPGIYQLNQKADLPFNLIKNQDLFIISKTDKSVKNIESGDILVSIDGMKLEMREEIEIYLDSKSVGEKIHIKYLHHGITSESNIPLVGHYSLAYIICDAISGFLFILFGIFVLLKCPENKPAKIFHWGSLGVAIILLYTWGNYTIFPYGLGIVVRILFQFAYVLTPVVFVYFSLVFPVDRSHRFKYPLISDFLLGIIIALINVFYFLVMIPKPIVKEISNYLFVFNINRTFSILNIIAAILIFILSYVKATNNVDRKKLKWLLAGFITGPFTFIVLWAIPQIFTSYGLIPEIVIPILMTAIPITFTIAIVKYHLMDIDLLIRRSVVYSIVVFFLIVIYIAIISGISHQILSLNTYTPSIIAAIVIALLFEPVRRGVQLYVDKKFFRVQYNFREALRKFLKDISEINSNQYLAEIVVKETQEFIPVDKIGFFLLKDNRIRMIAHQNFNLLVNRSLRFEADKLKSDLSNPVANPSRIEAGVTFEPADIKTFNRWGMDLVIPVRSAKGEIFAFIVLGEKKSGNRYTVEDIDLLNNVASNIAATIERINIQEQLIRKNMEAERLDELNKQKTLFVSTVSHDLRTPLASIKIFSEMLKGDKQIPEKQKQYLEMIEGESDRLTRLINNVLGFASMESGTRKYTFESISLNTIVKRTVETLSYQLKLEGFKVEKQLCGVNCIVRVDPDAVTEALINTIANAIKYSGKQKVIYISTFRSDGFSCIEVKDRGIGIKPEDLKNIFKPFFRSEISDNKRIRGTGLGLSIIKHVMDAHKGKIEVESVPGEGTAFILKFPIETKDNINPDDQDSIGNSLQKEED
jgi:signal transduction histidine kinase